jgi:hypothetical protein
MRQAPVAPDNAELMRNPQTRNQWFETVRENHERRQAPASREQPVQPQMERDNGRYLPRGSDAVDVRRERPGAQAGESRDGRDRRNAN